MSPEQSSFRFDNVPMEVRQALSGEAARELRAIPLKLLRGGADGSFDLQAGIATNNVDDSGLKERLKTSASAKVREVYLVRIAEADLIAALEAWYPEGRDLVPVQDKALGVIPDALRVFRDQYPEETGERLA